MTATNTLVNPSIVAKEGLRLLENNLVFGSLVNRSYEDEYAKKSNGNKVGDTISIRKPVRYTVRTGATATPQNTTEKTTTIVVNTQIGVDLQFSSTDLTLKISEFSEKYMKSAMIQLANKVDTDIAALASKVWNWVGTPGNNISTFAGYAAGAQRLDEMSVPVGDRVAALSPADQYALAGAFTSNMFVQSIAKTAVEKAKLPMIAGVDSYASQNVPVLTTGPRGGTPLVNGATQNVTYDGTNAQSLITDGWTATTGGLNAGDVFTLAGVFAVNPVTKATLPYLQQFVVNTTQLADGSGNATLNISPAIITSGAYQTVSAAPADNAVITVKGTAATGYTSNLMFHRDAFALAMVPMELPQGAVNPARETYKGLSMRVIPYYDGTNDLGNWRVDLLYGVKAVYPDLATRVNGA